MANGQCEECEDPVTAKDWYERSLIDLYVSFPMP